MVFELTLRRKHRLKQGLTVCCLCLLIYILLTETGSKQRGIYDAEEIIKFRHERYMAFKHRPPQTGPGEEGKEYILPPDEQAIADEMFKDASFNVYASDKISLDRSLPDTRRTE